MDRYGCGWPLDAECAECGASAHIGQGAACPAGIGATAAERCTGASPDPARDRFQGGGEPSGVAGASAHREHRSARLRLHREDAPAARARGCRSGRPGSAATGAVLLGAGRPGYMGPRRDDALVVQARPPQEDLLIRRQADRSGVVPCRAVGV
ncbi:outer membrane receptor protein [Streptomyces sp. OM5714]|nr:outer membrane receptor protein [Streptomyces sp. OM5714]